MHTRRSVLAISMAIVTLAACGTAGTSTTQLVTDVSLIASGLSAAITADAPAIKRRPARDDFEFMALTENRSCSRNPRDGPTRPRWAIQRAHFEPAPSLVNCSRT